MKSKEIIDTIVALKDYEEQKRLYESIGVDVVEQAIIECQIANIHVPHIVFDVRGPLLVKKHKAVIDAIMAGGSYEEMKKIYLTFGLDKVEESIKFCEAAKIKVPHPIYDVRGPLIREKHISIINAITAGKDYQSMKLIYLSYGVDAVEEAIKYCEKGKIQIPHIVYDVRGPLISAHYKDIISTILAGGDYETMKAIYISLGIERVEEAIKYCESARVNIPHIIYDVRGPLVNSDGVTS